MRLASFILSITLHLALFLAIFFWPSEPPVRLDTAPVQISLVEGAPGGSRMPSPVLGHQGAPGEKWAPSLPAQPKPEVAPPVPEAATPIATPKDEVKKPESKPEPKPQPKPEPKPEAKEVAEKKRPEPKKPEPAKEERPKEDKKDTPKDKSPQKPAPTKPQENKKPTPAKAKGDPVKDAMNKIRASRDPAGSKGGSAVERALAEAKRRAGGNNGGGGGEGEGPGGGGIYDVFLGQVMMAVRPNWMYANASRAALVCVVHVRLDANGGVVGDPQLARSSGNAQFDASAVNAVIRTGAAGQFPPPPGPQYRELDLVFNLSEMMGR